MLLFLMILFCTCGSIVDDPMRHCVLKFELRMYDVPVFQYLMILLCIRVSMFDNPMIYLSLYV